MRELATPSTTITTRIPVTLKDQIQKIADARGITVSSLVKEILQNYVWEVQINGEETFYRS